MVFIVSLIATWGAVVGALVVLVTGGSVANPSLPAVVFFTGIAVLLLMYAARR